ncbi:MAG: hypothetical protein O3B42_06315 [Actinomycetota bacterium]|nr:hypothetical protein [Actinomycetota bacterium]
MAARDLKDELVAIPGVSDAEVTLVDNVPPVARVWLDGTRDGDEVRLRVQALLGGRLPVQEPAQRRSGLGKGLDILIPDGDGDHRVPVQLKAQGESRAVLVARVAVVESALAVTVEIEDGAGNIHTADVGPSGSIDDAVLEAAAALSGAPEHVAFGIAEVEIGDARVLVVSASIDGRRSAGASTVEFGRPFAVARAARQALESL